MMGKGIRQIDGIMFVILLIKHIAVELEVKCSVTCKC